MRPVVAALRNRVRLRCQRNPQNTENFRFAFVCLSEASEQRITEQELDEIVKEDHVVAIFRPRAIIVIVAPPDEVFEIAQRWQRKVDGIGWSTHVARSRREALTWLRDQLAIAQVKL